MARPGSEQSGLAAAGAPFTTSTVSFTTPGGDGFTVEGLNGNLYTVFHHDRSPTVVFGVTLSNQVCSGWPGYSTYVNPTVGDPLGSGGIGPYATAAQNSSFIVGENLYWPVEDVSTVSGSYPVGVQCLNLTSLDSCGFIQLDSMAQAPCGGSMQHCTP